MKSFLQIFAFCGLAILLMASNVMADAGDIRHKLVPHKALYEIRMISRSSNASIINIGGEMFYEWRPSCEAWATDHRFNLLYEYPDSAPLRITSDFSTYETFDGKSFDYTSRRMRDGELYEELRGRAQLDENGIGEAVFTMPDGLVFDLEGDVLFPMNHTVKLMQLAAQGKKFFSATVFDGSDDEGPVEINSFISGDAEVPLAVKNSAAVDQGLIGAPARRVRMAFFPLLEPSADSDYEMEMVFHENGVISDMVVEYKDFSVSQRLKALEELESKSCKE